eukprot:11220378-Lingulodinium_polyedra.AAC.1
MCRFLLLLAVGKVPAKGRMAGYVWFDALAAGSLQPRARGSVFGVAYCWPRNFEARATGPLLLVCICAVENSVEGQMIR